MAVRGVEIFEGVGGDILNPRDGGGAYDDMLRALHDVVDAHSRTPHLDRYVSLMVLRDYYKHLDSVVAGASDKSYADLLQLLWPGKDWEATGGVFQAVTIHGSNPVYSLDINRPSGHADLIDHEHGRLRRVGQATLLGMTHGIIPQLDNQPDERYLANGLVVVPNIARIDLRDEDGELTGDSVRRALDPYEEQIAAIATNLSVEAASSVVIEQPSSGAGEPVVKTPVL